MNEDYQFEKWGSISRFFRPILITEKIDGTNAQVNIIPKELIVNDPDAEKIEFIWGESELGEFGILAGSRKRYVTPQKDNYGFAQWVSDNADELTLLGPGRHYGEWWGQKIQRNYGLKERRFSLFNVMRYSLDPSILPSCCNVVPLLYAGEFGLNHIDMVIKTLEVTGSLAAPGFMRPEGIVIFHTHGKNLYKVTLEGDKHKSEILERKLEVMNETIN